MGKIRLRMTLPVTATYAIEVDEEKLRELAWKDEDRELEELMDCDIGRLLASHPRLLAFDVVQLPDPEQIVLPKRLPWFGVSACLETKEGE